MVLNCKTVSPLQPKMLCAKFGYNWPNGSGVEGFSISSMYFRYFVIISPLERVGPFIWTNLNPLHPRMLCPKFGWNWPSGSGGEDFLILSMYFLYFVIISPLNRARPFFWTSLNLLHPKMLYAKFGWNWPSGSGEEKFTLTTTTTTTGNGQILIRKAHLSHRLTYFHRLWKQACNYIPFITFVLLNNPKYRFLILWYVTLRHWVGYGRWCNAKLR